MGGSRVCGAAPGSRADSAAEDAREELGGDRVRRAPRALLVEVHVVVEELGRAAEELGEIDAWDSQPFGARLQFTIDFDQTEMPPIIRRLDSILATVGGFLAS